MNRQTKSSIRASVRKHYGRIPSSGSCGFGCCGTHGLKKEAIPSARSIGKAIGYSEAEIQKTPEGANMGLGCGNPQAIAGLKPGEQVLDLGSGGGFDAFLAADAVGSQGRVIGVDMTPEMVHKARENREKTNKTNVTFRLGEIEHLPVADSSMDVIISNCVINLSPEKAQVLKEAFRVLKPGGRLAVADMVAIASIPESVLANMALFTGCVGGAAHVNELEKMLRQAGFEQVRITINQESRRIIAAWFPSEKFEDFVASASIEARKPFSGTPLNRTTM